MPADEELPAALISLVWTLHRAMLQAKKPPEGQRTRPRAQVELLQLVSDRPGIGVREAAESLRMKPNNVSSLVSTLVRDGLLERTPDPSDRRLVHLQPTRAMREAGTQVHSALHRDVTVALAGLPEQSISRIRQALPDLRALAEQLEPE